MGSIWDGIEEAKVYDRGRFMKDGFVGTVLIKKTIAKKTRNKGDAFIVEFDIVETNDEEVHPVGGRFSWFVKLVDKDIAFGNIAKWAGAMAGLSRPEEIEEQVVPELRDIMQTVTDNPEDNVFTGEQVKLETIQIKTTKNTDFTRYDWYPLDYEGED